MSAAAFTQPKTSKASTGNQALPHVDAATRRLLRGMSPEGLYAAWRVRDARLDGHVFIGVHTTGIYCRPICPAKTPLRKNVSFYSTAIAAQQAGFRACKRCRPESAPGTPAWQGSRSTVSRALKLISSGWAGRHGVPALAERLGLGERQLRRLFVEHLGVPPIAVLLEKRLAHAHWLLTTSTQAVAQIALDSGFKSLRAFNHAFKKRYRQSPSRLRMSSARGRIAAPSAGARPSPNFNPSSNTHSRRSSS